MKRDVSSGEGGRLGWKGSPKFFWCERGIPKRDDAGAARNRRGRTKVMPFRGQPGKSLLDQKWSCSRKSARKNLYQGQEGKGVGKGNL